MGKNTAICVEDKSVFAEICRIISDTYKEKITVEDIARQARLHPAYVMAMFKKNSGYTINTMITLLRINEAQRLLATSQLSITEIAFESGFQTVSNFYAAFQKYCDKTPKEYRKIFFSPL